MSGKTKKELLEDKSIPNQQALVDILLGSGITPIKRQIPGGKTILETLDKENMPRAVFNWLRGCGGFTEVTISFAKTPEKWRPAITITDSYAGDDQHPFWDKPDGRRELANKLAHILSTQRIVFVTAKPNGISIGVDSTKQFAPYLTLTEEHKAEYPELQDKKIGERISHPEWEPYILFKPANRSRYTNYRKD